MSAATSSYVVLGVDGDPVGVYPDRPDDLTVGVHAGVFPLIVATTSVEDAESINAINADLAAEDHTTDTDTIAAICLSSPDTAAASPQTTKVYCIKVGLQVGIWVGYRCSPSPVSLNAIITSLSISESEANGGQDLPRPAPYQSHRRPNPASTSPRGIDPDAPNVFQTRPVVEVPLPWDIRLEVSSSPTPPTRYTPEPISPRTAERYTGGLGAIPYHLPPDELALRLIFRPHYAQLPTSTHMITLGPRADRMLDERGTSLEHRVVILVVFIYNVRQQEFADVLSHVLPWTRADALVKSALGMLRLRNETRTVKERHQPVGRTRIRRKYTPQEKKQRQEEKKKKKTTIDTELKTRHEENLVWAQSMHEQFPEHTPEYYSQMLHHAVGKLQKHKRAIGQWNAWVSLGMEQRNQYVASGAKDNLSTSDVMAKISAEWKAMTPAERTAATAERVKELEERRDNRETGTYNAHLDAFRDVSATWDALITELQNLKERTGSEGFIVLFRTHHDAYNPPMYYPTSNRVTDYLDLCLGNGMHVGDLGVRMEAFFISGIESVATNAQAGAAEVKRQLIEEISSQLKTVSNGALARMVYADFAGSVTYRYGIILENWPGELCAPSKMGHLEALTVLNAWRNKATRFRQMNTEEWDAWKCEKYGPPVSISAEPAPAIPTLSSALPTNATAPPLDSTTAAATASPTASASTALTPPPPTAALTTAASADSPVVPPTMTFVHTDFATDGGVVRGPKVRKQRSDKDKPRKKPQPVSTVNQDTAAVAASALSGNSSEKTASKKTKKSTGSKKKKGTAAEATGPSHSSSTASSAPLGPFPPAPPAPPLLSLTASSVPPGPSPSAPPLSTPSGLAQGVSPFLGLAHGAIPLPVLPQGAPPLPGLACGAVPLPGVVHTHSAPPFPGLAHSALPLPSHARAVPLPGLAHGAVPLSSLEHGTLALPVLPLQGAPPLPGLPHSAPPLPNIVQGVVTFLHNNAPAPFGLRIGWVIAHPDLHDQVHVRTEHIPGATYAIETYRIFVDAYQTHLEANTFVHIRKKPFARERRPELAETCVPRATRGRSPEHSGATADGLEDT
ncbi:uncharacterized protein BXZ73DRAFT_108988 [Epithele typhae]|uniref:uncharacterized protein n=1 Tax=Epithele typhae TaxID=378194 RepID=UPI00200768F5|nr:uncharacterized protein BXZ73DRAFT_108988 [Epithele typhae]KAH9910444.1 hypothetical protein BXZ73DRAFT_108988 [Epithele typhae]